MLFTIFLVITNVLPLNQHKITFYELRTNVGVAKDLSLFNTGPSYLEHLGLFLFPFTAFTGQYETVALRLYLRSLRIPFKEKI